MPCSLRAGLPYILGASAQCSPAFSSCAVEWLCPYLAHSAGEPYDAIAATRGQVWKPALRLRCVDALCRRAAFRSRQVLAGMETRPTAAVCELAMPCADFPWQPPSVGRYRNLPYSASWTCYAVGRLSIVAHWQVSKPALRPRSASCCAVRWPPVAITWWQVLKPALLRFVDLLRVERLYIAATCWQVLNLACA